MSLNFNDADPQRSGGDLIPDNTIAPVRLSMRGEKSTNAGDARMLDCEFVVLEGPHAKRKFWGMMMITSNGSDGHNQAVNITRSRVRAMLESAYGIDPTDESDVALSARTIEDWADLDGLEFVAKIGVQKSKNPQYSDKNELKAAVTIDSSDYQGFTPSKPSAGMPAQTNGAAESSGASRWT